jgi:hypothetical protein
MSTIINDKPSFDAAFSNALANPYAYLGASATAIDEIFTPSVDYFNRVAKFAEDAAAKRLDSVAALQKQGQLYKELSQGLSDHLTGLKEHLDTAGQQRIDRALNNLAQGKVFSDAAIDNRLSASNLGAIAKGAGALISALQLAEALQTGSTNEVLKATTGVVVGLVVGLLFPPGLLAIGAGLLAGYASDIAYDAFIADNIDSNSNFWDNFFDSLGLNPNTKSANDAAKNFIARKDPLTFDLDGDGLETTAIAATNPILFDHDGDGIKNGTGWVKPDDGFLVLDRNGNGSIDNGRELFGDSTIKSNGQTATDGFDALADLDSNADGKIDANDAQFANLRIWRDLNQDGISQTGELFTLASLNIASINVTKTANSQTLANGNQIADLGSFTRTDGTSGTAGAVTGNLADINLASDTFHRSFPNVLDTSSVASLPDMQACNPISMRLPEHVFECSNRTKSVVLHLNTHKTQINGA